MKIITSLLCAALVAGSSVVCAQSAPVQVNDSRVLFTVGGDKVTVSDFVYVYTKNNINNQSDFSEKSLRDYLKLYENFRLKVKEAEAQKLDTIGSLQRELEGYRKQLAKSFLTDREITDKLMEEAYNRSKLDVNVSHILVQVKEDANPQDTAAAFKTITDYRKRLMKGEAFDKLAKETASKQIGDPSAKDNGGTIGWISAFQTVYPFETVAYILKKGEVSMPVRTQFGYHIVRVNDVRNDPGEMRVAHIMKKFSEADTTEAKKKLIGDKLQTVYNDILSGKISFDTAVVTYSDDRTSKFKGGELAAFTSGRMVPQFETAAYALAKDGDISKPVQTEYGWHIIKRLSIKPIGEFKDVKNDIKRKVERDTRSQVARNRLIARIKAENSFTENVATKNMLFSKIDTTIMNTGWKAADKENWTQPLFSLAGKNYTARDFADYLEKVSKKRNDKKKDDLVQEYYDNFVNQTCMDYEESQLENKKPEFRNLMREYRDGVLIFELTDRNVWSKAVKDTTGLQAFHETIKSKYMWGNRVDATIFNCTDEAICNSANKLSAKGKTPDEIKTKLNKEGSKSKVSTIDGKYEKGQYDVVDKVEWKPGTNSVEKVNDSTFRFVRINKLVSPEPKALKEAKGYVVSDYQEHLEKTWLADLRKKYSIVEDEAVLKSLIKK